MLPDHAIILAAGLGTRMRPLTDTTPKPLLPVGGKPLIEHHVLNLARAGVRDLYVNYARHGDQIVRLLGTGERYGVRITYSDEAEQPLETAGGVIAMLPLFKADGFLLVNADVYTDMDFSRLHMPQDPMLAHLLLVDNPPHHPQGDFGLRDGKVINEAADGTASGTYSGTYSGIGVFRRALFEGLAPGKRPLEPILRQAADAGTLGGERFSGVWLDVGTPDRLAQADHLADHAASERHDETR